MYILAVALEDGTWHHDASYTPERFMHEPQRQFTGSADILSFGGGVHHCTGAQLARMEMEVGLCHLLDAFRSLRAVGAPAPAKGFVLRSPESVRVTLEAA